MLFRSHIERNGHHYVDGMHGASILENAAWLSAHSDLYANRQGRARLSIKGGQLSLRTVLATKGLGVEESAARATFQTLRQGEKT